MAPRYIYNSIAEAKIVPIDPRGYMTRDGYTKRSGAPSQVMVRFDGSMVWRRLMIWQFSNAGTGFVRVDGECLIVPESAIPEVAVRCEVKS